jgi:hypothetical protein
MSRNKSTKVRGFGGTGGMSKHRKSGKTKIHPRAKMSRQRELHEQEEEERQLKERRKGETYDSASELFANER